METQMRCPYPERKAPYPIGTTGTIFTSNGCLAGFLDEAFEDWREPVVVVEDLFPACEVWIAIRDRKTGKWKMYREDAHEFDPDDKDLAVRVLGDLS